MRLRGFVLCAGAFCALSVLAAAFYSPDSVSDGIGAFEGWHPDRAETAALVGSGPAGRFDDQRHLTFARLFDKRFRDHAAGVTLKFADPSSIRINCAASIPRWDMARVATAAADEVRGLFGGNPRVAVYAVTALGHYKIAEGRCQPGQSRLQLRFWPTETAGAKPSAPYSDSVVSIGRPGDMPAVDSPAFVAADAARIEPNARVIGYELDGVAHAYALDLLDGHEVVNDTVAGRKIVVSWCSLCRTACIYDRVLDGKTLTFYATGQLLNNAMVMRDHQTRTLWSQVTGQAISGRLKGRFLTAIAGTPSITWAAWRRTHPGSLALSIAGREDAAYDSSRSYDIDANRVGMLPIRRPDARVPQKEIVLGIACRARGKAYRFASLKAPTLLTDTVGGTRVLVYIDPASTATAVYQNSYRGRYVLTGSAIVGAGGRWDATTGRSQSPGDDLTRLPHVQCYWFAWAAFHPNTAIRTVGPAPSQAPSGITSQS